MKLWTRNIIPAACLMVVVLTACSQSSNSKDAARNVETYLQALVDRDLNQMIAASCAEWESQARQEFNSFSAVSLTLQDLNCFPSGESDGFTHVNCEGSIVANYGAELLEIDIAERTFQVIEEGGDLRMCGYAAK